MTTSQTPVDQALMDEELLNETLMNEIFLIRDYYNYVNSEESLTYSEKQFIEQ